MIIPKGTKVQVIDERSPYQGWIGEVVNSVTSRCLVTLEDKSQQVFENKQLKLIIKNEDEPIMPTSKKTVGDIFFSRVAGDQILTIKIDKEIADLFKSDEGVSTSDNYFDKDGNKLKYQKETTKLDNYVRKFREQSYSLSCTLNRYGTNLIVDGNYNFSILRTEGIDNGVSVKVNDLILEDDITSWVKALSTFITFLHKNYIARVEIKATIILEI